MNQKTPSSSAPKSSDEPLISWGGDIDTLHRADSSGTDGASDLVGLVSGGWRGSFRGRRTIRGGRARVRAALYLAAIVANRHNPVIKAFYEKRTRAVKPRKSRSLP